MTTHVAHEQKTMRVRWRTLHPNIANKNNFDKILVSPKFQLPLTLHENQPIGFVPCKEGTNTRISSLIIDESKIILGSGFQVVQGFLLGQDFSDYGFLGDRIQIPQVKDS